MSKNRTISRYKSVATLLLQGEGDNIFRELTWYDPRGNLHIGGNFL